ncbi:hypothetical protein SmJEL517_g02712 [Synchytrium microbalum]|uniref:Uncharacterized protein n=1 Tax=Synchytrium microbalum TaxID=1806994 RepID=A0A507C0W5_9FUNG|nr:uncharacterized protein SmJEL517_g02712 [Synchytrium microbalum]TPX34737.1 hypothetical protein SmJEL517_g02712 [Synchytrium microbalum]
MFPKPSSQCMQAIARTSCFRPAINASTHHTLSSSLHTTSITRSKYLNRDFLPENNPDAESQMEAFMARLRHDGGDKIVRIKSLLLHVDTTRLVPFADAIKGLTLDQALLQLRWFQKPAARRFEEKLVEAAVQLGDDGWKLPSTYVAHCMLSQTNEHLSQTHMRKYVKGRGRYGSTPHPLVTCLDFTFQERSSGFQTRKNDPLEWIRLRLRNQQKPYTKTAQEYYEEKRAVRKVKPLYC